MRFTLIIALTIFGGTLYSEAQQLSGRVVDNDGEAIPFANAALYTSTDSTLITGSVTDIEGKFTLTSKPGDYYLKISFVSYTDRTIPSIHLEKDIDLGSITLSEDARVLDAVIVQAEKSQMELSLDKRVFEVGKDLSNISGTASDVLDNVPSVAVDVEGNVSLRGSQNVRILINGRPSSLTGINTADAMRQLQGNMIERVEIITNPSSRYDAEGEVGIINIILKKEKSTTGSFSVNTGYPDNYGGSFNLNLRKNRWNYFGGYGINYRSTPGSGVSFQQFNQADTTFSYAQTTNRLRTGLSHNARLGVDYTLPGGGMITATGLLRLSNGLNKTTNVYEDFNSSGIPVRTSIRNERETEPEQNLEGSLSYRKELDKKGKLLTADVKWIENKEIENSNFDQVDLSIDSTGYQRSNNVENERNLLFQADYINPFGKKGKFESGLKSTMRTIYNDFRVEQLNENSQEWRVLPQLNNNLTYLEQIHAAYFMIGNEHNKFSWQTGVRGELTNIDVDVAESEQSSHQRYLNIFPSAHLSYVYAKDRTLQLSYSYRVSRPDFRDLAPFSNYSDNRSVFVGNPNLRPEYTHSIETGYLVNWNTGSILSSAYYRYRTGVVERISTVDSLSVTSTMPVNLSTQNAYGLELNVSLNPVKWFRFNGNANFYRAVTEGIYRDQQFYGDTYTMTSRATSQFTMMKKWNLQVGANYRAPRVTPQGKDLAMYYADLGLSRDIMKGNGTITMSVRDVFNTRKYRTIIERDDIGYRSEREFQWRARQFLLTFSYRLNMKKDKVNDDRGADDYDEQ
jgi:outer membrane receptor protein involved in Fe transport